MSGLHCDCVCHIYRAEGRTLKGQLYPICGCCEPSAEAAVPVSALRALLQEVDGGPDDWFLLRRSLAVLCDAAEEP
jgi:hypothetical protein